MPAFEDLIGKKFNRLTVLSRNVGTKRTSWNCLCDCGRKTVVISAHLKNGNTKSCGCFSRESSRANGIANRTHGMTRSPEYRSWESMKSRCYKENDSAYKHYGARGIMVWLPWLKSFEVFLADMGPRPSMQHTLDRIDNEGHYVPGNCRWATPVEQANNKRNNDLHEFRGESLSLSQIAAKTGIPQPTLWSRLNRMKLTIEEAVEWKSYNQTRKKSRSV